MTDLTTPAEPERHACRGGTSADYCEKCGKEIKGYNAARMAHAWAVLVAEIDPLPPHGPNPNRWEPDRYNAAAFVSALLSKYAALTPEADHD